jgi:hypothetical protein
MIIVGIVALQRRGRRKLRNAIFLPAAEWWVNRPAVVMRNKNRKAKREALV